MALSERSRTAIYQSLEPMLGEEAVGEMLSYFPARDVEEPVTKEFLRAELAELRAEFHRDQRQTLMWTMGTIVASAGLVIAAVRV